VLLDLARHLFWCLTWRRSRRRRGRGRGRRRRKCSCRNGGATQQKIVRFA